MPRKEGKNKAALRGGWFRAYDETIDDPKVQLLPDRLFKFWFNCLCLASKSIDGTIPAAPEVSFRLRMPIAEVEDGLASLLAGGLLDWTWTDHASKKKLAPHNWSARQPNKDRSVYRMRRLRMRRNEAVTAAVTPCDASRDGMCDGNVPSSPPISPTARSTFLFQPRNGVTCDGEVTP